MKITVDQAIAIIQDVDAAVQGGKIVIEDVVAFLQSKGADATQLQANRATLVSDIADLKGELAADGAADRTASGPSSAV